MIWRLVAFTSSLLSLFAGLLCYTNLRPHNLKLHDLLKQLGLLEILRIDPVSNFKNWPQYLQGSLPDGLWMMALIFLILGIWDFKWDKISKRWYFIALIFGLLYEMGQFFSLWPGTFDLKDITFVVLFWLLPLFLIPIKKRIS